MTDQQTPAATAAASGASATEQFRARQVSVATSKERVDTLASEAVTALRDVIRRHKVSYDEYHALKGWLIQVGADGEWPLFLDVWLESAVEEVASESRQGSKGTIEGPYYVLGAPEFSSSATLPMRPEEKGTPLLFRGQVTEPGGSPLPGATVEMWHADADGFYSQFAPGIPEWNLRGKVAADQDGRFEIRTIEPAPYQIPTDGACGKLIAAAGWHAWRPAHLHLKVSAPEHQLITTQLYFTGDAHLEDDVATAVKPELVLDPRPSADGTGEQVTYDFALAPAD